MLAKENMQKRNRRDCFIPGCTSQLGQVFFMTAYKSDGLQRWWRDTIWGQNRKSQRIPKNKRVCEKHFEEKYIDRSYKIPRLFPDAWPTKDIEEPNQNEMELRAQQSIDGKAEVGDREPDINPKIYCRLCGNREEGPMELQLHDIKDGKGFLQLCLGEYFSRSDFPQGICNNCTESIESFVEFLKKCESTQHKLDVLFSRGEELQTDPENKLLTMEDIKLEIQDQDKNHENPRFEMNDEPHAGCAVYEYIKREELIIDDNALNSNEDYISTESYQISNESFENSTGINSDDKHPLEKIPSKNQETISAAKSKPKKARSGSRETSQICPICGKIFVHKSNLSSHMKIHSDKKDYVCDICGKQFYIRKELYMHIESFHEKKTFDCNICGIKCGWRKGLLRHMKNKHSNETTLKHKCTYCDKAFYLPSQLRLHVMKHTGDRITCDICGAGYRFNYALTQHKIREHGMEFKGVKLHKKNRRPRRKDKSKRAGVAIVSTEETNNRSLHVLGSNQEPILSSES
ncbi:zinc finger protein 227-like [Toxorhynchites rutilus septentrionalis]|uniref:zinc finger protein 227-like n=1 Tax=Toxorhynchites rutilus septentrionalis TaxID=329112 RepID=UPI00247884CC|nr:zinc finger protein 227-like [Toxorhynchites rutilus septentrionalis]